jgi:N-acetylglucosaminyldiphosphoundecaprenol N-acetyl-beta-D-mannosaminyltransferase
MLVNTDSLFLHESYGATVKTMDILGISMHCLSYEEMHAAFDWWISDKTRPALSVALVNVNCCVSGLRDPRVLRSYALAGIRGIDSMPFLWLARLLTGRALDRLYAPDILLEVARRSEKKNYRFFLYGGAPGAGEKIQNMLEDRFPGVQVVGTYCPPFRSLTREEDSIAVNTINEARPDFVWVGLGSPKQDVWIEEHRERIPGCVMVASGATFDFFSGRITQAPKWIRDMGFEWLFRLCHDWRRLWRRYTIYNFIFLGYFILQLFGLKPWERSTEHFK